MALYESPDMTPSADPSRQGLGAEGLQALSSVYAQEHVYLGTQPAYDALVGVVCDPEEPRRIVREYGQPAEGRLEPNQFIELHAGLVGAVADPAAYRALGYINVIHDGGKNPEVMTDVDLDPAHDSHDEGLRRLFLDEYTAQRQRHLPTYEAPDILPPRSKELVRQDMAIPVNWPGIMQSQSFGSELDALPEGTDPQALELSFWHGALDIAGALGHKGDPSVALALNAGTAEYILDAYAAFFSPPQEMGFPPDANLTGELRGEMYLALRAVHYGVPNYMELWLKAQDMDACFTAAQARVAAQLELAEGSYSLSERDARFQQIEADYPLPNMQHMEMKAKIMFANMAHSHSPEQFNEIAREYDALSVVSKATLQMILFGGGYTYDLDYGPALYRQLRSTQAAREGVQSAVEYMQRVLIAAHTQIRGIDGSFSISLRRLAQEVARPDFDPFSLPLIAELRDRSNIEVLPHYPTE